MHYKTRRVGAVLRDGDRLGRRASTSTSCRSAASERNGDHVRNRGNHPPERSAATSAREMTRMLQSMKHRGPDSTGFALYGPAQRHARHARSSSPTRTTPRDFGFGDRMERHRNEIEARLAKLGRHDRRASTRRPSTRTGSRSRLQRRPEGARRLRRGRARLRGAVARAIPWRSSRISAMPRRVAEQYKLDGFHRHPRDRPRPDGDRVRRGHLRRPPVLGVPVRRHRRRAQRPADELPPVAPAARAARATGSSPSATPRSSRSTWPRRWPTGCPSRPP